MWGILVMSLLCLTMRSIRRCFRLSFRCRSWREWSIRWSFRSFLRGIIVICRWKSSIMSWNRWKKTSFWFFAIRFWIFILLRRFQGISFDLARMCIRIMIGIMVIWSSFCLSFLTILGLSWMICKAELRKWTNFSLIIFILSNLKLEFLLLNRKNRKIL